MERHLFLRGGNSQGDSGLVLSTDAKPRLKWTPELHQRFIDAVNQLGGAEKATPKTVMRLMGIPGLTLYHLKSHLQVPEIKLATGTTASTTADRSPRKVSTGSSRAGTGDPWKTELGSCKPGGCKNKNIRTGLTSIK